MVPISATLFVTLPFPHCTPRSCRGEVLIWTGERLNKQKAKVSLMGFRPLEKVRVRWYWGILSPASKSSLYMPSLLTSSNNYVRNTCATKVKSGLKGKMQSFCNLMWTFLSIYLYPLYGDRKSLLEICKAAGNSGKEFRVLVKKKNPATYDEQNGMPKSAYKKILHINCEWERITVQYERGKSEQQHEIQTDLHLVKSGLTFKLSNQKLTVFDYGVMIMGFCN